MRRIALLLVLIVLAIVLVFGFFASSLFLTLLLASFFAILVDPVVELLERWRLPRRVGAALIVLAGLAAIALAVTLTYDKAVNFAQNLPEYTTKLRHTMEPFISKAQKLEDTAGKLKDGTQPEKRVPQVKVQQTPEWPSYLARGVSSVWGALVIAGVVPVLMFFMLVRKHQLREHFESWFGRAIDFPRFVSKVSVMIQSFVIGNLIIGSVLAACSIGVFLGIGLQGAVVLGILCGFLNLIPYLGLVLAVGLPVLAALLQFTTIGPFLVILVTETALHLIANNLAVPRLIGARVDVGPVVATTGILFWGWLWGGLGLLLAIPLTAFIKLAAESHPSLARLASFLSESARPVPAWTRPRGIPWARAHAYVRGSLRRKSGEKRGEGPQKLQ